MRLLSFIVLFLFSVLLQAQKIDDILIFNVNGNIVITRGDESLSELQGEKLQKDDILEVVFGNITFINSNNKRLTIEDEGTYAYHEIETQIQKLESSLTNRYFVYVWKKMNKHDEQVNMPGGVVRSNKDKMLPADSAIVLSDSIKFVFQNKFMQEVSIIIKTEKHKVIYESVVSDSLYALDIAIIDQGEAGKYLWQIKDPFNKSKNNKIFFIPKENIRNQMLAELDQFKSDISDYDFSMRKLLLDEYLSFNKIYL